MQEQHAALCLIASETALRQHAIWCAKRALKLTSPDSRIVEALKLLENGQREQAWTLAHSIKLNDLPVFSTRGAANYAQTVVRDAVEADPLKAATKAAQRLVSAIQLANYIKPASKERRDTWMNFSSQKTFTSNKRRTLLLLATPPWPPILQDLQDRVPTQPLQPYKPL